MIGDDHMTARVYVGTYAKYNSGSIKGAWVDLEALASHGDFIAECQKLHADEADPELMFQDYEGFPRAYYSESSIDPAVFDWLELDESDRELLDAYQNAVDSDADIDRAREAYAGRGYDTEADWAEEYLSDTGGLEGVPEHLKNYIDFEAYARDARLGGDMVFHRDADGDLWVFYGNV
jgi:antirestriction protein